MAGWNHSNANWKTKNCLVCDTPFQPKSGIHKFCSETCKGKWKYLSGRLTTESQYQTISGNWTRYFQRLCNRSNKRDKLTTYDLLQILDKQNYKCALSGELLTCTLIKGIKCPTNASIDRIIAGGDYTKDNVQLVCAVLNSFRRDTDVNEFINWCKKVGDYNK